MSSAISGKKTVEAQRAQPVSRKQRPSFLNIGLAIMSFAFMSGLLALEPSSAKTITVTPDCGGGVQQAQQRTAQNVHPKVNVPAPGTAIGGAVHRGPVSRALPSWGVPMVAQTGAPFVPGSASGPYYGEPMSQAPQGPGPWRPEPPPPRMPNPLVDRPLPLSPTVVKAGPGPVIGVGSAYRGPCRQRVNTSRIIDTSATVSTIGDKDVGGATDNNNIMTPSGDDRTVKVFTINGALRFSQSNASFYCKSGMMCANYPGGTPGTTASCSTPSQIVGYSTRYGYLTMAKDLLLRRRFLRFLKGLIRQRVDGINTNIMPAARAPARIQPINRTLLWAPASGSSSAQSAV